MNGTQPQPARRARRAWRAAALAGGAVALAAAMAVAFSAGNAGSSATGVSSTNAFDLPRLDGAGRVQLAALRGKPVVVNLFASWCSPCKDELPGFAKLARELRGQVVFVGVDSMDPGDGMAMARQFDLAQSGMLLARDIGPRPASAYHDALGAPGMPATAFYDTQGRLVARAVAAMPEATLRGKLRQLYGLKV